MPAGLLHIRPTLAAIMAAKPDAVTMHKGIAASLWAAIRGPGPADHPGFRHQDRRHARAKSSRRPRMRSAWAQTRYAVAAFIRGATEGAMLRAVADAVREAARFELPVICHIYPRRLGRATAR